MKQGYEIVSYNLAGYSPRYIFVDNYPSINRIVNSMTIYNNFTVDNFTVAVFKIKPKTVK